MRALALATCLLFVVAPRGARATTAADIPCTPPSPAGTCVVTVAVAVTPGSTLDFMARSLVVTSTGGLDAGGGNMVIRAASVDLQAGARVSSAGATLEIDTTGGLQVEGTSTAKARVDVSAIDGGTLTLRAGGDVSISGQLVADATSTRGDGGSIEVDGAQVAIGGTGRLSAAGGQGAGTGGDITVLSTQRNVSIAGAIGAPGADGGAISIEGKTDVVTMPSALLDISSGAGGSGDDEIDVTADTGGVSLAGRVITAAPGSIDEGGGSAADFSLTAVGAVTITATVDASGGGPGGSGGSVDISTNGDILFTSTIDTSAPAQQGTAGDVSFSTTTGTMNLPGTVMAVGPAIGGSISASGFAGLTASGSFTADGANGSIDLAGCTVNVPSAARLSSVGSNGRNHIAASGQMTVAGTLVAGATNLLEFLDPARPPVVTGSITPPPTVMLNSHLTPCGGVSSTTTTSATTSTTSTTAGGVTTTSTTRPPSTTTTTTIGGGTTTSTTRPTSTTTSTRPPTTSTSTSTTRPSTTTSTSTTRPTTTTTSTSTTRPTTTTTSTTTSATTSSSTTTSTTSTTGRPSTTTTAPPPTTTTTLPGGVCNPSDCDDGDPCTEDRCVAHVGCVHEPPTGFDAATCRLEVVATTLAAAAPVELGGGDTKAALEKRIARTIHLLERARTARGRLARDNPRRARQFVRGFIRRIQTGAALGRIPADLAQRLVVPARTALEVLYALAGLPPP